MQQESTNGGYPVTLRLAGRYVLCAGGGPILARRVPRLRAAGARVIVIAPRLTPAMAQQVDAAALEWRAREATPDDLDGPGRIALLFAATGNRALDMRLAAAARALGIPAQCAAAAEASDVLVPAVIDRGPLTIAVSSGGAAPSLTRHLRARLETLVPRAYGDLANLVRRFGERVRTRLPRRARGAFWAEILDGPVAEHVFAGRDAAARRALETAIEDYGQRADTARGEVYLVGSGPGDPDLLTFRALRLMQRADVVLYDSLLSSAILALVPPEVERIHVGKRAERHTLAQDEINDLMIDLARRGRRVLRLKGGDPFVFGRGGEEIARLTEAGIDFQIVPGVTAANGCAAYAGIPLTHRDHAQSVVFATGHLKNGTPDLSWPELARPGQTVVLFMARRNLDTICERLQTHGLPSDWPAALVIDGTTARQKVIDGTLADLPARVAADRSSGPALLIVGKVVRLRDTLRWFDPAGPPE